MPNKFLETHLFNLEKLKKSFPTHQEYPNHWRFSHRITTIKGFKFVDINFVFYKTFNKNLLYFDKNSSLSFYTASRNVGDKLMSFLHFEIKQYLLNNYRDCLVEHFEGENIQFKLPFSTLYLVSRSVEENPLTNATLLLSVNDKKVGLSNIYYNHDLNAYLYENEEFIKMYKNAISSSFNQHQEDFFKKVGTKFFRDSFDLITHNGKIFILVPYFYDSCGFFSIFRIRSEEFCDALPQLFPKQLNHYGDWAYANVLKGFVDASEFPFTYENMTFHSELLFKSKEKQLFDGDLISFEKNDSNYFGIICSAPKDPKYHLMSVLNCSISHRFEDVPFYSATKIDNIKPLENIHYAFLFYSNRNYILCELKGEYGDYYYGSVYAPKNILNNFFEKTSSSRLGVLSELEELPIFIKKNDSNLIFLPPEESDILLYSLENHHPKLHLFKELFKLSKVGSDFLEFSLPLINLDLMIRSFEEVFEDLLPFLHNKNVMKTPQELLEMYRNIFKKSKLLIDFSK